MLEYKCRIEETERDDLESRLSSLETENRELKQALADALQASAAASQEAAVLRELDAMGLREKRVITVWNKVDLVPQRSVFLEQEAARRGGGGLVCPVQRVTDFLAGKP